MLYLALKFGFIVKSTSHALQRGTSGYLGKSKIVTSLSGLVCVQEISLLGCVF